MKNIAFLFSFTFFIFGYSQTGIGTTSPSSSAILEVYSSNKGFLPPRIALSSLSDVTTIASPATGLMVFNTSTAGSGTSAVTPGYYYYNGSKWQRIVNHDKQLTNTSLVLNNVAASNSTIYGANTISNWSASYTSSGGDVHIHCDLTLWSSSVGNMTYKLLRDGSTILTKTFYFNYANFHLAMPPLIVTIPNETGTHTYAVRIEAGTVVDANDYCTMTITENNIP